MNSLASAPLTDKAAIPAQHPGTGITWIPAAAHARTTSFPGSEMQGVPASVTSTAFRSPSRIFEASGSALFPSLCRWQLTSGAWNPKTWHSFMVTRVSSAIIRSAVFIVSTARGEKSCRLPIGVATTYNAAMLSPPQSFQPHAASRCAPAGSVPSLQLWEPRLRHPALLLKASVRTCRLALSADRCTGVPSSGNSS